MKRLAVIAVIMWVPAYCGGDVQGGTPQGGYPLRRSPEITQVRELQDEIARLKQELEEAKAEVTAEDAKHKCTDVKKLMGYSAGGDQTDSVVDNPETTGTDLVLTCVTVDGVKQTMHCDAPNCHEVAHNVWFSVDTGIMIKRCDKHKDLQSADGVVEK